MHIHYIFRAQQPIEGRADCWAIVRLFADRDERDISKKYIYCNLKRIKNYKLLAKKLRGRPKPD